MMVFFRTRLRKISIWQKFSETWESDFKIKQTKFNEHLQKGQEQVVWKKVSSDDPTVANVFHPFHATGVCTSVCVFISVHHKGFSWLNRTMDVLPDIQASYVMLRKLLCVKNPRLHVMVNHRRDLLASNCARVSIKLGIATRSKRQLLKLSKNQQ